MKQRYIASTAYISETAHMPQEEQSDAPAPKRRSARLAVNQLAIRYLRPLSTFIQRMWASSHRLPFDAAQWQTAIYDNYSNSPQDTIRVQMVENLLQRHDLIGLSARDVLALLGQPIETSLFSDWDLLYFLGPTPGLFNTNHLWLGFQLDDQQRVIRYQVVAD